MGPATRAASNHIWMNRNMIHFHHNRAQAKTCEQNIRHQRTRRKPCQAWIFVYVRGEATNYYSMPDDFYKAH